MKHLLLFISVFFIISCSSSDDSSPANQDNNTINPPEWIQGVWYSNFDGVNTGIGFKITSDDFCTVLQSTQNCWKELVETSEGQLIVSENISDTDYAISFIGSGSSTSIHLQKVSATEIKTVTTSGLETHYYKQ